MSFATLIVLGLAVLLGVEGAMIGQALWRGSELARASTAFERVCPDAARRLLVVGDSTAVGTGAARPEASVAGRLAGRLPDLAVVNLAADGARVADVVAQLGGAPERSYDAVLIQVGGNDILRFTSLDTLRAAAEDMLSLARDLAPDVVLMTTGDVGTAPALPFPVDRLYSQRTVRVHTVLREAAAAANVTYLDFRDPAADDPFQREPERFYARDGLHPSGEGYRLWTEKLIAETGLLAALGGGDPASSEHRAAP